MVENGTTTIFANQFYSKQGATTTKYIFANNQLVATVEKTPSTTTIAYIHTDNLSGTSAATNDHGEVIQDTDYYPFGSLRVNTKQTGFTDKRKFSTFLNNTNTSKING